MINSAKHDAMANAIRILSLDSVERAKSGHLGLPLGAADIATVLFSHFLKFDPKAPHWPDRDRFVLSAGHGSMLLYSALYLLGYEDTTIDELKNFRQLGAKTAGHPEYGHLNGVETTTGPLGQGIANAVGMAIAETKLASEFGSDLVDHFTYALVGDGCLMEGISHEAAALAGHLKLNKLIVLWDDNDITIDGYVSLADSTDQIARFVSYGWNTISIDGHNAGEIKAAIQKAQKSDKPTLVACKTTAGFGAPTRAGTPKAHGGPYGAEEAAGVRKNLGWTSAPFEVPEDIIDEWRLAGLRSTKTRLAWESKLENSDADIVAQFNRRLCQDLTSELDKSLFELKQKIASDKPAIATRKASHMVLEIINSALPETMGGSADLNGSNLTKTSDFTDYSAQNRAGRFVNYGVREHAMAAALNGMALHGGLLPYSGGFFIFSDYCRASIRLAALMGIRVIHVMTHDSIGVGEDGPTHQPVEHLASFRAMPNINVFRPADASETLECWHLALLEKATPSILALTRQGVPAVRTDLATDNLCARGAYVLSGEDNAEAAIFASGSEVSLALEAAKQLSHDGVSVRVVSFPCFELFEKQSAAYRAEIIGSPKARVAVEAGVRQPWDRYLGDNGKFVGMDSFGASAPASELFTHFSITVKAIVKAVTDQL
ncbi:Transketolase [hydrothermal vent metagenome]|uniref:transketolase n=1 Tax=hydrothermal vent metagenome TaxID=652676 RepID=A0A3B0THZ5_9ZZZZ